ncbi:hypothetical protein V6O07_16985, partial [Arthrospira platensis SPKY2]
MTISLDPAHLHLNQENQEDGADPQEIDVLYLLRQLERIELLLRLNLSQANEGNGAPQGIFMTEESLQGLLSAPQEAIPDET